LSADVVIMHVPGDPESVAIRRSLDELEPYCRERHVRIAIENGNFDAIGRLLSEYDPAYLGLCYDSGHGNSGGEGLDHLERLKGRLISVHLHDNDGTGDQHKLLFSDTVDWSRLARIMAQSAYAKCPSMEVSMRLSGIDDEGAFLRKAFETGTAFARMVAECKRA
jgi:sugar phosphate isomerase/epimerase